MTANEVYAEEVSLPLSNIQLAMANITPNQRLGPQRGRKQKHSCGICGKKKQMSRAHVPAQCAGNRMLAKRHRFLVNGHGVNTGHGDIGEYTYTGCARIAISEQAYMIRLTANLPTCSARTG